MRIIPCPLLQTPRADSGWAALWLLRNDIAQITSSKVRAAQLHLCPARVASSPLQVADDDAGGGAEPRILNDKEKARVKQVFATIDTDGSGAIDMEEVRQPHAPAPTRVCLTDACCLQVGELLKTLGVELEEVRLRPRSARASLASP